MSQVVLERFRHFNEGVRPGIIPLMPQGTNSTFFTECCGTAITDDQTCCPSCNREIVGADEKNEADRNRVRWRNATRYWKREGARAPFTGE